MPNFRVVFAGSTYAKVFEAYDEVDAVEQAESDVDDINIDLSHPIVTELFDQ